MKNIHILATDKPSRLCLDDKDILHFAPINGFSIADGKANIYITSLTEEVKEEVYGLIDDKVGKIRVTEDGYEFLIGNKVSYVYGDLHSLEKVCKKIILTTDSDLIDDGVQAIDDEFLEWFEQFKKK